MTTLVHEFLARAAAAPEAPAVVTPAERWTYARTAEESARVAAGLRAAGVKPGDRVGLLFSHGAQMIGALLGVLRLGASYVPLDAAYPRERLAYMADAAGAEVVLAGGGHAEAAREIAPGRTVLGYGEAAAHAPAEEAPAATPEAEAYMLFTSGSTGRPKPIVQTHRNVLHHARVWIDGLSVTPADRLSLQSAYSWDSAVQDTFAALLSGAALYPVDFKALGTAGLLEWMAAERISVYHSTLPVFRALVRAMEARSARLPAMRVLALGGDTVGTADIEAYRRNFEPHCLLAGAYGSSECSCALLRVADRDYEPPTGVFPLGFPVAKTRIRLEDERGREVHGPGEGEIVVVSDHLAPGSGEGGELRTGDLARRLPDGTLLLIGRRDFQVKISGIRVETGEVESALGRLPGIREAVVQPFTDGMGERQLAAYLVPEQEAPTPAALRASLRAMLPDHAVPTAFVFLDALPLTANHKIDRAALPAPSAPSRSAARGGYRTRAERAVAEAWREVLGLAEIGPDDNFFDLGGTSVRAAAVHERLVRELAPGLKMTDLYRAPTVRRLARLIDPAGSTGVRTPRTRDSAVERGLRRRALARRPLRTTAVGEDSD